MGLSGCPLRTVGCPPQPGPPDSTPPPAQRASPLPGCRRVCPKAARTARGAASLTFDAPTWIAFISELKNCQPYHAGRASAGADVLWLRGGGEADSG